MVCDSLFQKEVILGNSLIYFAEREAAKNPCKTTIHYFQYNKMNCLYSISPYLNEIKKGIARSRTIPFKQTIMKKLI
jgi:hypothetical protein